MRKRNLGKTGLSVSELALGTWGLSGDGYGAVPESEQDRVIERARAYGINLFETADTYGEGKMESRLGERLPDDGSTYVVTKLGTDRSEVPARKRFDAPFLRESFEKSRERLRREIVDVVLLHNPSLKALNRGDACGFLEELKAAGKIRTWGVSVTNADVGRTALERGALVLSLPYNVFSFAELRKFAAEIKAAEVGLLAHSVLAYGVLSGLWGADKEFDEGDHRADRWTSDEIRRRVRQLDAVRPLVAGDVTTLRSAAVRYVLANELVSSAILGPKNAVQLDQLVREAGKSPPYLPDQKLVALEARLHQVGVRQ